MCSPLRSRTSDRRPLKGTNAWHDRTCLRQSDPQHSLTAHVFTHRKDMGAIVSTYQASKKARHDYAEAKKDKLAHDDPEDVLAFRDGKSDDEWARLKDAVGPPKEPFEWPREQYLCFVWVLYYRNLFFRPAVRQWRTYYHGWKRE